MSQLELPLEEIWKPVVGYEGLYEVSNYGNVASLNYGRTGQWHLISPCKTKKGYLRVALVNDKKAKNHNVHRLVAFAFIPNHENKPFIHHKNHVTDDNRVDNLEWCTAAENNKKPLTQENRSKTMKRKNPNSIQQIWERASEAGEYPYNYSNFHRVYNDQTDKHYQLVRDLAKKYTI